MAASEPRRPLMLTQKPHPVDVGIDAAVATVWLKICATAIQRSRVSRSRLDEPCAVPPARWLRRPMLQRLDSKRGMHTHTLLLLLLPPLLPPACTTPAGTTSDAAALAAVVAAVVHMTRMRCGVWRSWVWPFYRAWVRSGVDMRVQGAGWFRRAERPLIVWCAACQAAQAAHTQVALAAEVCSNGREVARWMAAAARPSPVMEAKRDHIPACAQR
eukprot:363811-Chlamydomonas_euryale.AAC.2